MSGWAVVVVRGLASGKTRLSPVLSELGRRLLNEAMLRRTLEAVAQTGLNCVVVTPCAEAAEVARTTDVISILEEDVSGQNEAAAAGLAWVRERGTDADIVVLPTDLPYLNSDALQGFLKAAPAGGLSIAADYTGAGTNAICLRRSGEFWLFLRPGQSNPACG
ncbi:NTP transferase domain-containing protein [Bradyrhizobium ottawaense]|uniref:NTP transferase domain-containing protein n=1 Tax=Bradyrhizobium ottawaense TaxID=931866 RepID=UPI0038512E54